MSLADKAARVRLELKAVEQEMRGLSPKTSSYKKLAEKKAAILYELEQLGAQRTTRQ